MSLSLHPRECPPHIFDQAINLMGLHGNRFQPTKTDKGSRTGLRLQSLYHEVKPALFVGLRGAANSVAVASLQFSPQQRLIIDARGVRRGECVVRGLRLISAVRNS